jgi:hypothetical protein
MAVVPSRLQTLAPTWGNVVVTAAAGIIVFGAWRVVKTRSTAQHDGEILFGNYQRHLRQITNIAQPRRPTQACFASTPLSRRTLPVRPHTPGSERSTIRTRRPASCLPTFPYWSLSTAWVVRSHNSPPSSPASSTPRRVWRSTCLDAASASSSLTM